jgi:hypothetical protein
MEDPNNNPGNKQGLNQSTLNSFMVEMAEVEPR